MIRPLIAILALVASGAAGAAVPIFAAKCPNGLTADSDSKGRIYVSGKLAKVINRPDGQVTAQSAGLGSHRLPGDASRPRRAPAAASSTPPARWRAPSARASRWVNARWA